MQGKTLNKQTSLYELQTLIFEFQTCKVQIRNKSKSYETQT